MKRSELSRPPMTVAFPRVCLFHFVRLKNETRKRKFDNCTITAIKGSRRYEGTPIHVQQGTLQQTIPTKLRAPAQDTRTTSVRPGLRLPYNFFHQYDQRDSARGDMGGQKPQRLIIATNFQGKKNYPGGLRYRPTRTRVAKLLGAVLPRKRRVKERIFGSFLSRRKHKGCPRQATESCLASPSKTALKETTVFSFYWNRKSFVFETIKSVDVRQT